MEHQEHRLAAVIFTDIVGFSKMMEEDERGTLKTLDFHNRLVREQVEKFRGRVIKTIGDAFLAQFNSTLDAVECSLAIQESIRAYNESGLGKSLTLRIGVHLGDIYFYENDALGEGINIASRLQAATRPGHITISREVYGQVSGKIPMRVESRGQLQLKNITREVHAYEIIPGGEDNNSPAARQAQAATALGSAPAPAPEAPPTAPPVSDRPPGPPPSFRDLREEWRSLRDEVRQNGGPGFHHGGPGFQGREEWRTFGTQLREEIRGEIERAQSQALGEARKPLTFEVYKEKKLKDARGAKAGFWGHLMPFLGVNAFLFFLNFGLGGAGTAYPWFLYPLLGWGIGLVSHWASVKAAAKAARDVEKIDDASEEETRELKKFHDARAGIYGHFASNGMVMALLAMIWWVNGGGFPWHLIPIAGIGIGMLSHFGSFMGKNSAFKDLKKKLFVPGRRAPRPAAASGPAEAAPAVEVDPRVRKAKTLRDSIVNQAEAMKGAHPFEDDLAPTLDNFVLQITELSAIEKDLGQVLSGLDLQALRAEEAAIRSKIETSTSTVLKEEYGRSLEGVTSRRRSWEGLAEQQEILGLKIQGAMGNLQQVQVDLARVKGLADGQADDAFLPLRDKSEELSRYIEDYRSALKEIPG